MKIAVKIELVYLLNLSLIYLLNPGIHPTAISDAFLAASAKAVQILEGMSIPIELSDRSSLLKSAVTSLNSKVVSQHSALLAPIAVDAVLRVINPAISHNVDLNDIRLIKKVGGTIDDTELVDGVILTQEVAKGAGGPSRVDKAKIGLIQFHLSPPKPDVSKEREKKKKC